MLKSIFVIAISCNFCINVAAQTATSPLPLLINQCLQLPSPIETLNKSDDGTNGIHDLWAQSYRVEKSLLGLFNVKDRLLFYKSFPLAPFHLEALLHCQLRLSDMMSEMINSAQIHALSASLLQSEADELTQLGMRISTLIKNETSQTTKSQLYTAQASVKHGLRSKDLTFEFTGTDCLVTNPATQTNFHLSIASYLIRQKDQDCKKRVWQAYQGRARKKNMQSLIRIADIRQKKAQQAGFVDHSTFSLANQFLSSPELVSSFLDVETNPINIPPWEIGNVLSTTSKTPVTELTSIAFIQLLYAKANTLGFKFDIVTEHIHRVWFNGRLLGDIYFNDHKHSQAKRLRAPVQGWQFGQVQLNTTTQLSSYRDKQALVSAMATALSQLSASHHYYLVNVLGETSDTSQLGQFWLEHYLSQNTLEPKQLKSQEDTIAKYSTQLKVFRAKVALDFYRHSGSKMDHKLPAEFAKAFGQNWDQPEDFPYSFLAITDLGPLYYQQLWQRALANLIYLNTQNCQNQQTVFELLLVNEDSLNLKQRLTTLLGQPSDPASLIKRIQDASNVENQPFLSCHL